MDGQHTAGPAQRWKDEVRRVHDVGGAGEPLDGRVLRAGPGILQQPGRCPPGRRSHPGRQRARQLVQPAPGERRRREFPPGPGFPPGLGGEPGEPGQQMLGVAADPGALPEQRRAVQHDPHAGIIPSFPGVPRPAGSPLVQPVPDGDLPPLPRERRIGEGLGAFDRRGGEPTA